MTESYWQRGGTDRWAGGTLPRAVDFAVLGGGFAGLATAIHLRVRHPSSTIAVFEAERVGYGASGRNAGFLSPLAAPVWLLGAERSAEQAWGARKINAEIHAVARWIGEVAPACELAPATLALQAGGRVSDGALREFVRAVERCGLEHRVAERSGCTVLQMAAYSMHPYKLVCGLAEHAVRIGVQLHERARVQRVEGLRAGGARVLLDGAIVEATKVVACTNAYTSSIDLGERPAALVVHGMLGATAPLATPTRDGDFTVEVNAAQTYHRMHAGRVIYGGIDTLREPGDRDRAKLQALVGERFPGLAIEHAWSGPFHATATGLPIIRTSEDNHALVLNVGYGGTGVALSLACARLAACVASNGTFTDVDDTRLLALIHSTRISIRDSLRTVARIARGVAMPWL